MKRILTITICALAISLLCSIASNASTGNINLFAGQKTLDSDDWEPLDKQTEGGVEIDFRGESWPINMAIDIMASSDEENMYYSYDGDVYRMKFEATTTELDIGVRKIWDNIDVIRPYLGCGIGFISAEIEGTTSGIKVSDEDTAIGIWLNGGIYATIAEHFNIGLDLRYSNAKVELFDTSANAGGTHFGLILGYHW